MYYTNRIIMLTNQNNRNFDQTISSFKKFVIEKQPKSIPVALNELKKLIEKNPDLLDQEDLMLGDYEPIPVYKQIESKLTLAEFGLIYANNEMIMNFIVETISPLKLKEFLQKKFQFLNDNRIDHASGFHIIAVLVRKFNLQKIIFNKLLTILEKDQTKSLDEYLSQMDSYQIDVINVAAYATRVMDCSTENKLWLLFLEAAKDKGKLLTNPQCTSKSTLLHQLLHFRITVGELTTFLNAVDDKLTLVIQNQTPHTLSLLHIALLPTKDKYKHPDEIVILLMNAYKKYVSQQQYCELIFNNSVKDYTGKNETPFEIAVNNTRANIVQLFLKQIDYENLTELKKLKPIIEKEFGKYTDIYQKISLTGLLNMFFLLTNFDEIRLQALSYEINKRLLETNAANLPNNLITSLCVAINEHPTHMQKLVDKERFAQHIRSVDGGELVIATMINHDIANKLYQYDIEASLRKLILNLICEVEKAYQENNSWQINPEIERAIKGLQKHVNRDCKNLSELTLKLFSHATNTNQSTTTQAVQDLLKMKSTHIYPEASYLLAVCYRYGLGIETNCKQAAYFYKQVYQHAKVRLEFYINNENSDHCTPLIKRFLHNLIRSMGSNLNHYFMTTTAMSEKLIIAEALSEIFLLDEDQADCRAYLDFIAKNQTNCEYNQFLAIHYYQLTNLHNQQTDTNDLAFAVNLKYGPALIEQAAIAINPSRPPSNFALAALSNYEAITTTFEPQNIEGTKGLALCLEQSPQSTDVLDCVIKLLHFIDSQFADAQIKLASDVKKVYKDFITRVTKFQNNDIRIRWMLKKINDKMDNKDYGNQLVWMLWDNIESVKLNTKVTPENQESIRAAASSEIYDRLKKLKETTPNQTKEEQDKAKRAQIHLLLLLAITQKEPRKTDEFKEAINKDKEYCKKYLDDLATNLVLDHRPNIIKKGECAKELLISVDAVPMPISVAEPEPIAAPETSSASLPANLYPNVEDSNYTSYLTQVSESDLPINPPMPSAPSESVVIDQSLSARLEAMQAQLNQLSEQQQIANQEITDLKQSLAGKCEELEQQKTENTQLKNIIIELRDQSSRNQIERRLFRLFCQVGGHSLAEIKEEKARRMNNNSV